MRSFLCELALSKIINLSLNFVVIYFSKNSTNRSVFIPLFSYNSHPKTPLVEIAKMPVYFLKTFLNVRRCNAKLPISFHMICFINPPVS